MATALITGASSGIGAAFARTLAERQYHLVLVARSQQTLEALSEQLTHQHGIEVTVIPQDLTAPAAIQTIMATLEHQNIVVDLLVNNAGFGNYGEFATGNLDTYLTMLQLNIVALVALTHRCLQGMRSRRSGSVLNVGSTASFQPLPYLAVYAATKAFVLSFSEALWYECQPYDINVLAVCPGPTETGFAKVAAFPDGLKAPMGQIQASPEAVVAAALKALERSPSNTVVGGLMNQFLVNATRFLPRETITKAVGHLFKIA